jgi:hypothetical protein
MKKCHFSILYNELPFLKQKMKFLYDHFEQLIFYDLNVGTYEPHYSTDGSHEFISEYPDPENKITLIEKKDLSDVNLYKGDGSIEKRKMFAVGSSYVQDDVDSFWCFDLDEFIEDSLIDRVNQIFQQDSKINSINVDHYLFFYSTEYILADTSSDFHKFYSRIARHQPNTIYGHCTIANDQQPSYSISPEEEVCFHLGWLGNSRVLSKIKHYTEPPTGMPRNKEMYQLWLARVWNPFPEQKEKIIDNNLYGYPYMHPNVSLKYGVRKFEKELPNYINQKQLMEELNHE